MWRWAGSSERRAAGLALAVALHGAAPAAGRVLVTVEEALRLAFPDCALERATVYPTPAQLQRASALAGEAVATRIVHPYRATRDGAPAGTAYFDTHVVRTLPETVMVVVDPEGKVARVEVVAFAEPPDYLPRGPWYAQFAGRGLDAELALERRIRGVTGATLTARATTAAVRRVLALHQVLQAPAAAAPPP
jgi:hypothetical protein